MGRLTAIRTATPFGWLVWEKQTFTIPGNGAYPLPRGPGGNDSPRTGPGGSPAGAGQSPASLPSEQRELTRERGHFLADFGETGFVAGIGDGGVDPARHLDHVLFAETAGRERGRADTDA